MTWPDGFGRLVLLRHGESTWNALNLFTGWVNVPLSPAGEQEAVRAGRLLAAGLRPEVVHTSVQRRAIQTADLALAECDRDWISVRRSWRLNSNHYGVLQGQNKDRVRARYGERQYQAWRRQYDCARRLCPTMLPIRSSPTRGMRPFRPMPGRGPSPSGM